MIRSVYNIEKFPDGTPHITLKPNQTPHGNSTIVWLYDNMEELVCVAMIANDIYDKYKIMPSLVMPYIPNARMDRAEEMQDVFTLKYFANIINSLPLMNVYVFDPHSFMSEAMIKNLIKFPVKPMIKEAVGRFRPDAIYFPDAGAMKRYKNDLLDQNITLIFGEKERDWNTGEIKGLKIHGDFAPGSRILMIDDICSYGGTLYYSALALKGMHDCSLGIYVSHCENSIFEGNLLDKNPELIDRIYTTNSIYSGKHEKIAVIKNF